jgi:predicted negative regulator of RcsB-dependent stress response
MVDLHLSDDEQAERLKAWWKQNGSSVIVGAVVGIGVIVGVNFWRDYKTSQGETASALYEMMLGNYREQNISVSETTGGKIMGTYSSTPYAGKAALLLAKMSFDKNDLTSAKSQLRWAMNNAIEPATVHAARLRLARILLSEKQFTQVGELISIDDFGGFESEYKELRGDLHMAQGEVRLAREAYLAAAQMLPEGSSYGDILKMKADNAVIDMAQ